MSKKILVSEHVTKQNNGLFIQTLCTYCQKTSHGVLITEVMKIFQDYKETSASVSSVFVQLFSEEEVDKFVDSLKKY